MVKVKVKVKTTLNINDSDGLMQDVGFQGPTSSRNDVCLMLWRRLAGAPIYSSMY